MRTDFSSDTGTDPDHLDALDLREAILGDGVVLHETADGGFVIHVVTAGEVQRLGSYVDAAAAWRALDDIDRHPDEWNLAGRDAGEAGDPAAPGAAVALPSFR